MKILAIETATEACSAALYNDGEVTHRYELAPRKHTQLILPMLDEVLNESDVSKSELDAIAFGRGPGAFTGLRIAVGIAQGLALSLDKPLIAISTLAAMAQQILETQNVTNTQMIPAIDARMSEVYWGHYANREGEAVLTSEEQVSIPELLLQQQVPSLIFGSGWEAYHAEFLAQPADWVAGSTNDVFPSAEHIATLASYAWQRGELIDAADAEPTYLRNNVAKKKADQGSKN
ncbi:tRNA (adenosine(37)-N6)-threonylcarbamoyltransferase complex dimerization subunit type 1 TsaB [Leucothrix arctica]|uniref:tRNA threonylcarbamoyladenosine biosynthesis protein TsaB n=1 Tax=Leucothrix arctica TaxID=1481894 RepID=A0A317CTH5_9GAMM|nr:tRNA (adenosine(37)-N6)-threonylcarbamoyltransferase complex dimerization subunit type 1 TsaB [Leucothrix arctica]PWQ99612.1 tRNA (adenosine(37)-N6)-threonylcarbamoyltransferase complex dimerization subunit type 1 TsaB [Leucothrix arctica]